MTKQELAKQIKKWREEAENKFWETHRRPPELEAIEEINDFTDTYLAEKILEMMGKPIKVNFYQRERTKKYGGIKD